eukprot:9600382-Karenia_brevis.AAC.1
MQNVSLSKASAAATKVFPMPVPACSTAAFCGTRHCTRTARPAHHRKSASILSGRCVSCMMRAKTAACH